MSIPVRKTSIYHSSLISKWVFSDQVIPQHYNALHTYVRDKPPDNELWHFGSMTGLLAGLCADWMYCKLDPGQAPRLLPSPPLGRVALKECDDWDGEQSPAFMLSRQELWLCDCSLSELSDMCGAFCLSVYAWYQSLNLISLPNLVYL